MKNRRPTAEDVPNIHIVRSKGMNVAANNSYSEQRVRQIVLTRMQVGTLQKACDQACFSPYESRLQSLELQEKVEALLLKNPSPGSEEHQVHHVLQCHTATRSTSISAISIHQT